MENFSSFLDKLSVIFDKATILSIMVIFVTILLGINNLKRKGLRIDIISKSSLISLAPEVKQDFKVFYKDLEVSDIELVEVKLSCVGNKPILSADFETNITFEFGTNARVLSAYISETSTQDIGMKPKIIEYQKVELSKALLNPGDTITVKILVTEYGEFKPEGRISGVKNFKGSKFLIAVPIFFEVIGDLTIAIGASLIWLTAKFSYYWVILLGMILIVLGYWGTRKARGKLKEFFKLNNLPFR